MFYRQKLLLALLESFGGSLPNRDLQKYLFLYTSLCEKEKSYEFVPYKYGCFSFQSYADKRNLIEAGYLINTNDWQLSLSGHDLNLKSDELQKIKLFSNKYASINGEDLVRYVYKKFPYFAINSEIASRLLSKTELAEIEKVKPSELDKKFFTIGYEGGSFEGYLNKVIKNKISTIIDVRKNPISRKYGFSKKTLSETLQKFSIDYVHMPELGIESEKRQLLKSKSDFENLFNEYDNTVIASNKNKLNEINQLLHAKKRIAITCFEADYCMCHRGRIADALQKQPEWECATIHL